MFWVEPSFRDLIQQGWEFTTPPVVVVGKVGVCMEREQYMAIFFVPIGQNKAETEVTILAMCNRFAESTEAYSYG